LTHCLDTKTFLTEMESLHPELVQKDEETGALVSVSFDKTFTVRNGKETLSILMLNPERAAIVRGLASLSVLSEAPGSIDLLKGLTVSNREIYDRIYDQTPVDTTMEDGTVYTHTPSELFCSFGER
ncbi:MAG: hypothetical protein R8M45_04235, partial [Ghiorsea sp.]